MSTQKRSPRALPVFPARLRAALDSRHRESMQKAGELKSLVLSLLVAGAVLGLGASSASAAASTTTTVTHEDTSFSETATCGFQLDWHYLGSFKVTSYFDTSGILVKSILTQTGGPFTVTVINPATGKTATSGETSVLITTYNPDGSVKTQSENGLVFNFHLPGTHGPIALDVGHVVFDSQFNILQIGGPHQIETGDTSGFCAALA